MSRTAWIFEPITGKKHSPDCEVWQPTSLQVIPTCTCVDVEDEMIQTFTRTPVKSAPLSDPQGPYQSLASLIRAARTAGLLKPIQQYGGGHATAASP